MKCHCRSTTVLTWFLCMSWIQIRAQAALVTCAWNDKDDLEEECYSALEPLTIGIQQWFFLGDSTMFRVLNSMSKLYGTEFQVLKSAPPTESNKLHYFGYATNMRYWVPPNKTLGEGPSHGQPFRTLCSSCRNTQMEHKDTHVRVEFLAVEHALDVEFPTYATRTSQETVVKYIMEQQPHFDKERTLCVANTGFHELLMESLTAELYAHNVVDYWLHMLQAKVCQHIIWININSMIVEDQKYKHLNRRIQAFNEAVLATLHNQTDFSGAYVDIYPYSRHAPHMDAKHMSYEPFYFPLTKLYHRLLLAGALTTAPPPQDAEKTSN